MIKVGQIVIEQQQTGPSIVTRNTSATGVAVPRGKQGVEALEWALDNGWKLAGQSTGILGQDRLGRINFIVTCLLLKEQES